MEHKKEKSLEEKDLKEIAVFVRNTAVELSKNKLFKSINYYNFPRACCGLTSWTLAWVLHDIYSYERIRIVEAERDNGNHVWVEINQYYIDLTCSQFHDCKVDYIFAKKGSNKFLESFKIYSYASVYGTETKTYDEQLLYDAIIEKLDNDS